MGQQNAQASFPVCWAEVLRKVFPLFVVKAFLEIQKMLVGYTTKQLFVLFDRDYYLNAEILHNT